jgi:hypothetical protein
MHKVEDQYGCISFWWNAAYQEYVCEFPIAKRGGGRFGFQNEYKNVPLNACTMSVKEELLVRSCVSNC